MLKQKRFCLFAQTYTYLIIARGLLRCCYSQSRECLISESLYNRFIFKFIQLFLNGLTARVSVCFWRIAVSLIGPATVLAKCCLLLMITLLINPENRSACCSSVLAVIAMFLCTLLKFKGIEVAWLQTEIYQQQNWEWTEGPEGNVRALRKKGEIFFQRKKLSLFLLLLVIA